MANPSDGSVYASQRIYTELDYNRCDFSVYLRIIDTLDADVVVLWDSTQYRVDMINWEKQRELSSSEWSKVELTLYGGSCEIEIRLQTMGLSYISMDDASLECYKVQFYENPEAQLLFVLVLVVIVAAAISFWYRKSMVELNWCSCIKKKPRFEPIILEEEFDVDTELKEFVIPRSQTENLTKALLESDTLPPPPAQSASSSSSTSDDTTKRE
jgi:hypothetical protein